MKKTELLSPAGNMRSLKAAISAGCDAIYIGGKHFGARQFSNNFDNEELIEAINYSHRRNVKVYVTVNTLIYEDEIEPLMEYVQFLHQNNVDALIIQDIGMADLIHQTYPNLELHASTQMHIHNLEGVKFTENLGLKRVVLARETNIDLIKKIKKNTHLEIELFVHGALCMSYSGECLISSLLGGRSGNRGTCSQCCRMPYTVITDNQKYENTYPLSTKDLNTLENIGILIDNEIDSFKIEGRMKSEYYVYTVTKLYREAIDNYIKNKTIYINQTLLKNLKTIFNREFTKGFIFNEENNNFINPLRPNHMGTKLGKIVSINGNYVDIKLEDNLNTQDGIRIIDKSDIGFIVQKMYKNKKEIKNAFKGDTITLKINEKVNINSILVKTKDNLLNKKIDEIIEKDDKKIKIKVKMECFINKNIILEVTHKNNTFKLIGDKIEKSINSPIKKEEIISRIKKIGNTPYEIDEFDIKMDNDIFIRIASLNELKRQMIIKLDEISLYKIPFKKENYKRIPSEINEEKGISVLLEDEKYYDKIKDKNFKYLYLEEIYPLINDSRKIRKLLRVKEEHYPLEETLLVGELGSVNKYKNVITDYSLNVTNSYSVALLHSIGVKRITLSYELNDYQIEKIINNYYKRFNKKPNLELIVSSIPDVMITKFNLFKYYKTNNISLKNNKNYIFKIENKNNFNNIKFYKKIELNNYEKYFNMGINTLRIEIIDEKDIKKIELINQGQKA